MKNFISKYVKIIFLPVIVYLLSLGCLIVSEQEFLPDTFLGPEELVSLDKYAAALGYFHTTPENPSGTKIAYTALLVEPTSTSFQPAAIYVRDRDGSPNSAVLLTGFDFKCAYHDGAYVVWIDDDHLAFVDGKKVKIISTKPGQKAPLVELDGKVGHNTSHGEILFYLTHKAFSDKRYITNVRGVDCVPGVYKYNMKTDKVTPILTSEKLFEFLESKLGAGNAGKLTGVSFTHAMFNPSGTKVALRVDIDASGVNQFVVSFDANSLNTDLVIFKNADGSYKKPLHQIWFDDETLLAVDNGVIDNKKQIKRWYRDGTHIETLTSTKDVSCHIAFSPLYKNGKRFVASESNYHSDPISFNIYEYGQTQNALQNIFSLKGPVYTETVWKRSGHINPSFSVDGKYIYYNKPDANGKLRIYRRAINPNLKP